VPLAALLVVVVVAVPAQAWSSGHVDGGVTVHAMPALAVVDALYQAAHAWHTQPTQHTHTHTHTPAGALLALAAAALLVIVPVLAAALLLLCLEPLYVLVKQALGLLGTNLWCVCVCASVVCVVCMRGVFVSLGEG
jgi:hypothetical protein